MCARPSHWFQKCVLLFVLYGRLSSDSLAFDDFLEDSARVGSPARGFWAGVLILLEALLILIVSLYISFSYVLTYVPLHMHFSDSFMRT